MEYEATIKKKEGGSYVMTQKELQISVKRKKKHYNLGLFNVKTKV